MEDIHRGIDTVSKVKRNIHRNTKKNYIFGRNIQRKTYRKGYTEVIIYRETDTWVKTEMVIHKESYKDKHIRRDLHIDIYGGLYNEINKVKNRDKKNNNTEQHA